MSPRRADQTRPGVFTSPLNGGFVHAPSVNHGAAAAVLRSVHLAHAAAGHGEAFSVDLSSARVRCALGLLEGIRAGQPLAALLGYLIERGLTVEGLARLIAGVRAAAPLLANKLTPGTGPAETIAATNVVDGLTLLADAGYDGDQPPSSTVLLRNHPSLTPLPRPDRARLDRVLREAADALDALADLMLSESVFQAVQGNPARAGAAVDSLAGVAAPSADPGVVRTPRTGVGVTHRVIVLLGDGGDADDGWTATPRALAEPRLDAWARAWLPAPAQIGVRARFTDATGVVAELDDLTLGGLQAAAAAAGRDDLPLGALDLVSQSSASSPTPRSSAPGSSCGCSIADRARASRPTLRPPTSSSPSTAPATGTRVSSRSPKRSRSRVRCATRSAGRVHSPRQTSPHRERSPPRSPPPASLRRGRPRRRMRSTGWRRRWPRHGRGTTARRCGRHS